MLGRPLRWPALVIAVALVAAACSADDGSAGDTTVDRGSPPDLGIEVVSTRADIVTGGDALIAVTLPADREPADVTITSNGANVSDQFTADGMQLVGLVDGLAEGENELAATAGDESADLTVVNHPIGGPVFSGPHFPLQSCTTESFDLPATTIEEGCWFEPIVRWVYVTAEDETVPLEDPATVPDDAATVEVDGEEVPFVIRQEWGAINRGINRIDVLDPSPEPDGAWDAELWNGRLVYQYGGGCGTSYSQGFFLGNDTAPPLLAEGYATATSTFNTHQVMCNETLSAETTAMVKEYFGENYGVPDFTIGFGGSGGAIQQYVIANTYPGLLDAISPVLPFPDFSIAPGVFDCGLLQRYYGSESGAALSAEQRVAINGHLTAGTCDMWALTFVPAGIPTEGCNLIEQFQGAGRTEAEGSGLDLGIPDDLPLIAGDLLFDPDTNPDGLRCTVPDSNINVFGADPETGYARFPFDNTGVQYGLDALAEGAIDVDQFLDLNEQVGTRDVNGEWTLGRSDVDEDTVRALYETGRVTTGDGPLSEIPIITTDVWSDDAGDIHDRVRAFTVHERLRDEEGNAAPNHMIWTRGQPGGGSLISSIRGDSNLGTDLVGSLDNWLTNLAADESDDPIRDRLERARPESAVHNCLAPDGERVAGLDIYEGPGPCTDPFPISAEPRMVAGAPLANDIVKCQLQTVDSAFEDELYGIDFTAAQRTRLDQLFEAGVCDYTQRGVGQVPSRGSWLSYGS